MDRIGSEARMKSFLRLSLGIFIVLAISVSCRSPQGAKIPITTSSPEALKLYQKGIDSYDNLRVNEAQEYFKRALEKDPNFAMAHLNYGMTSNDIKILSVELNKALELIENVSEGERLLILGEQASLSGLSTRQLEYYLELVKLYPQDERAYYLLGNYYYFQQDYNLAIGAYRRATEINPKFAPAYNMLGYSHRQLENFEEAEQAFKRYIAIIPNNPNPYDSYAELLMKKGEFEKSIDVYQKALKVEPHFFPSVIGIATNLNFLERHSEALNILRNYLTEVRTPIEKRQILYAMMVSYLDHNDYSQALEINDSLLHIAKQKEDIGGILLSYQSRGVILFELGRTEEAQHFLQLSQDILQQSDLSPEFKANAQTDILYQFIRIKIARNELTEAKIKAEEFGRQAELKKNRPQIWRYHELLGLIALKENKYDEALGEFRRSNLQDPRILYQMAVAYRAKGEVSQATKFCQKVVNYHDLNSITYSFVRHKAQALLGEMGTN